MGMPAPAYYTADMVRALPDDGNRYEVVYGEVVGDSGPAPVAPGSAPSGCCERWVTDLDREPVGHLLQSPADISWGPDILVQPDLFVAPLAQVRTLEWTNVKDLLLVIEVLSPSSKRGDRFTKRRLYQEQRIPLYWVVDGDERVVEVWTPDARFPVVEREGTVWDPVGASGPFTLQLAELFRPI